MRLSLFLALLLVPSTVHAQIATEDGPGRNQDRGYVLLGQRNDTPTTRTSTDGDYGTVAVDQYGRLLTNGSVSVGAPTTEASYPTLATLAGTSLTGSYQALLTDSNDKTAILIDNRTDADIYISLNGSTNHFFLPSLGSIRIPLGDASRKEGSNVSVKYVTAAGTSGTVYASAVY